MQGPKHRLRVVAAFILGVAFSPWFLRIGAVHAELSTDPCAPPAESDPVPTPVPPPPDPPPPVEQPAPPEETPSVPVPPSIRLNEVFPDPEGADETQEFIEVENFGDGDADLAGWKLENAAGKTFTIAVHVAPHGQYAFPYAETKIALVNSGMTLTLRDAGGTAADVLTYAGPAKTGKAYARDAAGVWAWTSTPTPGAPNQFDPPPVTDAAPSPTPSPAPPPAPESSPVDTAPSVVTAPVVPEPIPEFDVRAISIVAFMPDPVGDDANEWIKLGNAGAADARLDDWMLDDDEGGSRPYALAGVIIPGHGTTTIAKATSQIALNNDQDAVRLLGPDGAVLQRVPYAQPPEGKTFEFIDGEWRWTPSGDDARLGLAATMAPEAGGTPPDQSAAGPAPETVDIGDLDPTSDELVSIEGVVSIPPGIIGKRTFAMQQKNGEGGVFVRAYGRDAVPPLAAGDVARITGRAARSGDRTAFATLGRRIERLSGGTLRFQERAVDELDADDDGIAVSVRGVLTHRGKTAIVISDGSLRKEVDVRLRDGAAISAAAVGATLNVKGVVRAHEGKFELIAAGKGAIEVVSAPAAPAEKEAPIEPPKPAPAAPRQPLVFSYAEKRHTAGYALGGIAAALAATAVIVIMRRRHAESLERMAADR